ncbi:MAG: DMT family transporter [Bacteroidales bacterium]|nr:DMT family transporter [Candidatus Physcousia equi]
MLGELISLSVAISWTATALFADVASRRLGSLGLNVVRMGLSLLLLALTLWLTLGTPLPPMTNGGTWLWLCLSGFVGYVLGDYCLFQCYVLIGARFGQLLMTLSAPSAAITAWLLLGERLSTMAVVAGLVTLTGIAMSILSRKDGVGKLQLKLPMRGVLLGIGAGMGQGIGLVLSKVGMGCYTESLHDCGISDPSSWTAPDALLPIPVGVMMPFASTMIRAIVGLLGFVVAITLLNKQARIKLRQGAHDATARWCALGATLFGPFIGVSLSLMATLYTHAGIAQTIMAMTPVFILLPSWLLFRQRVTWMEVVGAMVSVVGVSLFFL